MSQQLIQEVEKSQYKADLPKISIGDTVDVHVRIIEGAKERIQVFNGVVIAMSGGGINATFTVRRIVANEGVERIFPLHSPRIATIEVKRHGHVRRSKLYYLRERVGKKRRLRDRRRGLEQLVTEPEKTVESPEPAAAKA
ncbi:MAG: 50S ribosomal protein L19 [Phycisphaeraceae bacterium]|nr:50S ribosomal protein L19 [Phycisphaeraceae bacterium]